MTTKIPSISVQLYSLREASKENFDAVLIELAQIGFKGVEPFNLYGKSPQAFKSQVNDLGMQVSSSHTPWVNRGDSIEQSVEVVQALGLNRAAGGFAPDDFKDMDAIKRAIDVTQHYVDALKPHGISLFLHNHYWEYDLIDGRPGYHYLQDAVPDVTFELDTYWTANFGQINPADEIRRVKSRMPLMHVKDGPLKKDQSNVAVGTGEMDVPALFEAADETILEWAIVEFDHCDTDMMTGVAESYRYLTENNLAQGNV